MTKKKPDDKQRRLDEIARLCHEALRGPSRHQEYYFREIRKIMKLARGDADKV